MVATLTRMATTRDLLAMRPRFERGQRDESIAELFGGGGPVDGGRSIIRAMVDPTSRRAMLRAGAALAGGCAASLIPSQTFALTPQEAARNGIFDVKAFGAAGQ